MKEPLFSIIIPVYNLAEYIAATLRSVSAQTENNWECICINDGSQDASADIIERFVKADRRFILITQPNGGASAARNTGLANSNGQYITFLDGDDLVAENWLENYRKLFCGTNVDLVRIRFAECKDGVDLPLLKAQADMPFVLYKTQENVFSKFLPTIPTSGYVWQYCLKSEIAKKVMFPLRTAFIEDLLYTFDVMQYVSKVCQSEYRGYYYRQRILSARTRKVYSWEWENLVVAIRKLFEVYESKPQSDVCLAKIAPLLTRFCWYSIGVWIRTGVDQEKSAQIHAIVKEMYDGRKLKAEHLKTSWRICFLLYVRFAWQWPMRLWLILSNNLGWLAKYIHCRP